jgi:hypothetical protein
VENEDPLPLFGVPFGALQEYVPLPPDAVKFADCPTFAIWEEGEQVSVGNVTVTEAESDTIGSATEVAVTE